LKNSLKEKLKKGEAVVGTFIEIGHPDVTEWLSRLGFDWLLLDAEHAPAGFETLQLMMQAMNGTSCIPIVRPQWNDLVVIKRVLDLGAYGVLVPWVNSKEEAENAVRACRYPPEGIRGFGPRRAGMFDPDYYQTANEELLIAVQIETEPQWDESRYLAAFDRVLEVSKQHGKPAGMFATLDNIEWALEKGFKFNTVDCDDFFLIRAAKMALEKEARGAGNK